MKVNSCVYMFHAIGNTDKNDWADKHYSYSVNSYQSFIKKLSSVSSIKNTLENGKILAPVITFDDGHISNFEAGLFLSDGGFGSADFFINSSLVGNPYYMSWEQIAQLDVAGMSIQSHGDNHCYLSDCDDKELYRQLKQSKFTIEDKIGSEVTILAPPGGRFDSRTISMAKSLGYKKIVCSKPGGWSDIDSFMINRVAVLKSSNEQLLLGYLRKYSVQMWKLQSKYRILKWAKSVFGNTFYEKIRSTVLMAKK